MIWAVKIYYRLKISGFSKQTNRLGCHHLLLELELEPIIFKHIISNGGFSILIATFGGLWQLPFRIELLGEFRNATKLSEIAKFVRWEEADSVNFFDPIDE